jgi:hypothetical protein
LEARAGQDPPVQRERVINVIMLMTSAIAERASAIEDGASLELDELRFIANLADMIVAGIEASHGAPLRELHPTAGAPR